ncbi:folate carrier protein Flx1 [Capsaspora owczarzaki ATCC 30864]|uniref:Folate carrier protein Flx1 n=1 Tax=Capsaspora owczarzaki (strain ATCC 30864) TaxID=595528 RepID=A0A0D2URV8_CAPO3|nr:folate carrier protein Flx1 [Capsaspora owczarzaki ATCC 30864]
MGASSSHGEGSGSDRSDAATRNPANDTAMTTTSSSHSSTDPATAGAAAGAGAKAARKPPTCIHLLGGAAAGLVTTTLLHPLDLIKIRMQVHDGTKERGERYRSSWHAFKSIKYREGPMALYRGLTPNLVGSTTAWGLYFFIYNIAKSQWQSFLNMKELGPAENMAAAVTAGVGTQILTNPIWVVKTRMCSSPISAGGPLQYRSLSHALGLIWRQEGLAGFYRGILPGLLSVSHGSLQFMAYEEMKKWVTRREAYASHRHEMGTLEYTVMAAASKMFATIAAYPFQLARTRLQVRSVGCGFDFCLFCFCLLEF